MESEKEQTRGQRIVLRKKEREETQAKQDKKNKKKKKSCKKCKLVTNLKCLGRIWKQNMLAYTHREGNMQVFQCELGMTPNARGEHFDVRFI